jgi:hypothetical protein
LFGYWNNEEKRTKTIQKEESMKYGFIVRSLVTLLLTTCLAASIDSATPSSATAQPVENEVMQSDAFYIGQHYGGGIIFWIDNSGQHGLIAAESDQGFTWWSDRYYPLTGATGTDVGTGRLNTKKIIAAQGRRYTYAARLCANYRGGGYSDWFLPSKDELYLLYQQKSVVGGFIRGSYWSSSEFDHSLAWTKFFYNDSAVVSHKDRSDGVRAIREF